MMVDAPGSIVSRSKLYMSCMGYKRSEGRYNDNEPLKKSEIETSIEFLSFY